MTGLKERGRAWRICLGIAVILGAVALIGPYWSKELRFNVSELKAINVNGLTWNAATGTVIAGSNDPQWEYDFPWWARPVSSVTVMIEPINRTVGEFQAYYLKTGPGQEYFMGEQRVDLRVLFYNGVHAATFDFPEIAHRVRIDPPNTSEFTVKEIVMRAWPVQNPLAGRFLKIGLGLFAGLAIVLFFRKEWWERWVNRGDFTPRMALILLGALVLVRLWLTLGQPLKAVGGTIHDDQHFINQALSLLEGRWLGDYDHLTLIKGQGYPLWIAAMYVLHIPLVFSQHLIYALAAALAYVAWRPALSRAWRLAIVALILFCPASFHGDDSARVLRNHFCASLALLTFVAATGWFLRAKLGAKLQARWAVATGIGYTALWLSREEAVWMGGVLALIALGAAWQLRKEAWPVWRRVLVLIAFPVGIWAVAVTVICALNYRAYQYWGTVEFRGAEFRDAYGALARINVGPWRQFVPVSREMREAAYPVSPTFSKLKPYFEGGVGVGWAFTAESTLGLPPEERQIHGAGFMWALRDAAAASGEHLQATRAKAFYRTMADEINAACDDGRLPALPHRSGFVPPWRPEYTEQLPPRYFEAWKFITTFAYVVPRPPPSTGEDGDVETFRWLSRSTLQPRLGDAPLPPALKRSQDFKNGVLKDVTRGYTLLVPFALVGAVGWWLWLWLQCLRGRLRFELIVLATVALAGASAITLVVTLVHVTSFVAITIGYLSAAYPLMMAFIGLTFAGGLSASRAMAEASG